MLKIVNNYSPQIDEEKREVTFIISDSEINRNNHQILTEGLKIENFKKNPLVGYQHQVWGDSLCGKSEPDDVIGYVSEIWKENDQVFAKVKFETEDINPNAEKVFKKIKFGSIRATSIGILPEKMEFVEEQNEQGEITKTYNKVIESDLAELSIVHIPANKNALIKNFAWNQKSVILNYLNQIFENKSENEILEMSLNEIISKIEGKKGIENNKKEETINLKEIEKIKSNIDFEIRKRLAKLIEIENN